MRLAGTHALPAGLEQRVASRIGVGAPRSNYLARFGRIAASHLAAAALGALLLYAGFNRTDLAQRTARDAVAAHARALMSESPVQVASSDTHTVKPWFAGRIAFSPLVKDLAASGFPLLGGRVDHVLDRPAAVIVYGRRMHLINLFVQPAELAAGSASIETAHNGYNVVAWRDGGFAFLAVSDLNAVELKEFVRLVRG